MTQLDTRFEGLGGTAALRLAGRLLLFALAVVAAFALRATCALADEVACEKVMVDPSPSQAATSPHAYPTPFATIWFNEPVCGDANPQAADHNLSCISLLDSAGRKVEGARAFASMAGGKENYIIYVSTDTWLDPMAEYQLHIDPGVMPLADGEPSTKEYSFPVTTCDQIPLGFGLVQLAAAGSIAVAFAAGLLVALLRRRAET